MEIVPPSLYSLWSINSISYSWPVSFSRYTFFHVLTDGSLLIFLWRPLFIFLAISSFVFLVSTPKPGFCTLEACVWFPPNSSIPLPCAPFPFSDYTLYSFTVISHSHDDNHMMSAVSPPSESLSGTKFGWYSALGCKRMMYLYIGSLMIWYITTFHIYPEYIMRICGTY